MNTRTLTLPLALAIASLAAPLAHAHAKIDAAEPKAGSELASAPKEIILHFNEKLEPAFSKIELFDAGNAPVKLPKALLAKADPKTMATPLPPLPAGQYQVRWTAMARDGHKVKGEYRFKVK